MLTSYNILSHGHTDTVVLSDATHGLTDVYHERRDLTAFKNNETAFVTLAETEIKKPHKMLINDNLAGMVCV